MTISGKNKEKFENANIARLCAKKVKGEWVEKVSSNSDWQHFFPEIMDLEENRVKLYRIGWLEIQEDDVSEYVIVKQKERGLFTSEKPYKTRLRPFKDDNTEKKRWMD